MERPTNKELKKWGYAPVEQLAKDHHKAFLFGMKYARKILLEESKEFKKSYKDVSKFLSRERTTLFQKELDKRTKD